MESSIDTDRVAYGCDRKLTLFFALLYSDTTPVPGEIFKAQGLDEPHDCSAKPTPDGFPALTDRSYSHKPVWAIL